MVEFVHLHVHSHYSLLDGLSKIDELTERAKSFGSPALALTDHGNMYGAIEFYLKCKEKGLKPIIGLEAYITEDLKRPPQGSGEAAYHHLTLLAKDLTGYQNLMKLTSLAHLEGWYFRPRIDHQLLKAHREGLIALSGCLQGELPQAILAGRQEKAQEILKFYHELFGEDFFLELQFHPRISEQAKVNAALLALAARWRVPAVATADAHYVREEDQEAQDVLLCIQTNTQLSDPHRFSMKHEFFDLPAPEIIAAAFRDQPEVVENTLQVAIKTALEIPLDRFVFPHFVLPAGVTAQELLRQLVRQGLKEKKVEVTPEIKQRLELELSTIERMGFENYFLVVADYVNWAKKEGIVVGPGRGSAAGSLVSYLLGITSINPLEHNLLFERFLNPERISLPDIDIDFADDRRDEVINYVREKYGRLQVAQIATFGTMASRAVVRDVGRALGMSYSEVDRVAKLVPPPVQGKHIPLKQALETIPDLKEWYEKDAKIRRLFDIALKLEGTVRHVSTHAAGVVIADKPLYHYTPIQYAPKSERMLITQYAMGPLERVGLIKIDFLGLKNLTIIRNTLRILRKTQGTEVDIETIRLDDPKTYQLLSQGKTVGVFQLEGEGITRYLKELRPTQFSDLVAMVALYRPGPMQFIPDFIDRKRGRKKITYLHPKLEPILKETYGIAVYQEQVLKIAQELCGFSLGEADVLRKAIGKKIRTLLAEQRKKFVEGAVRNGLQQKVAEKLFDFIEPFASYGFNRAHSVCYAMIAYWTAYLKANFPHEFMAALLTSDQSDLDRTAKNIAEAESLGIKVLPPSVNESFTDFAVVKATSHIRFGLNAIKNVGRKVSDLIIEERKQNGLFQSLSDFINRVPKEALNRRVLESLIKAGALDEFGDRARLLAALDFLVEMIGRGSPKVSSDQLAIFRALPAKGHKEIELPLTEPLNESTKLAWEKEYLGTYVSHHPFKAVAEKLGARVTPIKQLDNSFDGRLVKVAGIVTRSQPIMTRTGEPMKFIVLEDLTGSLEVIVFPRVLKAAPALWVKDKLLFVEGIVNVKDLIIEEGEKLRLQPEAKVVAHRAFELSEKFLRDLAATSPAVPYLVQEANLCRLSLPPGVTHGQLQALKMVLERYPGQLPVELILSLNGGQKRILTHLSIQPSPELQEEIRQVLEGAAV